MCLIVKFYIMFIKLNLKLILILNRIKKLIESGIFNLWDKLYLTKSFRGTHFEYNNKEHINFNLEDMITILYILLLFVSISFVALLIEIIYLLINDKIDYFILISSRLR